MKRTKQFVLWSMFGIFSLLSNGISATTQDDPQAQPHTHSKHFESHPQTDHKIDDQKNFGLTRNQVPAIYSSTWMDRIRLSGLFVGELIYSTRDQGVMTRFNESKTYSTLCFPRANAYVDARLDTWATAHFGLRFISTCGYGCKNDEAKFFRFGDKIDDAFVTLSDFDKTPFWGRIGPQHVPYGDYPRNVIPANLTQLLTQSQVPALTVGYAPARPWQMTGYVFSGKKKMDRAQQILNGGIQFGFKQEFFEDSNLQWTLDWMYNIAGGVNYVVNEGPLSDVYRRAIQGIHAGVKGEHQHFDGKIQYTQALSKFDPEDLAWRTKGGQPKAFLIDAGYSFESFCNHTLRMGGSYQRSWQAVNVRGNDRAKGIPKRRWQADTSMDLWKNAEAGLHFVFDRDYRVSDGGTGRGDFVTLLNLTVWIA